MDDKRTLQKMEIFLKMREDKSIDKASKAKKDIWKIVPGVTITLCLKADQLNGDGLLIKDDKPWLGGTSNRSSDSPFLFPNTCFIPGNFEGTLRIDALVFKLWRSGSFNYKTMAAKLYRRQYKRHSATSDGLWFHYLDERRALTEMIDDVHHTAATTGRTYDILLVVYRQCEFAVVTRGYRASENPDNLPAYRSNGQIIWKGGYR